MTTHQWLRGLVEEEEGGTHFRKKKNGQKVRRNYCQIQAHGDRGGNSQLKSKVKLGMAFLKWMPALHADCERAPVHRGRKISSINFTAREKGTNPYLLAPIAFQP